MIISKPAKNGIIQGKTAHPAALLRAHTRTRAQCNTHTTMLLLLAHLTRRKWEASSDGVGAGRHGNKERVEIEKKSNSKLTRMVSTSGSR